MLYFWQSTLQPVTYFFSSLQVANNFPHLIMIILCESSAKVENLIQKLVLMELDFGTKFTLHLWFTLGVRGIFGQLLVSLVSLLFCDYFVELLREWWCQNQTSKQYRANRFYDCF